VSSNERDPGAKQPNADRPTVEIGDLGDIYAAASWSGFTAWYARFRADDEASYFAVTG
jgi:hypothetical protein